MRQVRPFAALLLLPTLLVPARVAAQSATFASLSGASKLPVQRYDIDWPHSAVEFSVRFMGLSTVRGAFGEFAGTIMYDTADVTRSSVAVVIKTASINTNVASRDRDLRSANFFDAEKYPLITFRSTRVERAGDGLVLRGPLTMRGVTREVAIPFRQTHQPERDAWGNVRIGFVGRLTVSRQDFGILGTKFWNSEYDPGRMSIADSVEIDLNVQAEVNNVERWTTPKGDSLLKVAEAQGMARTLEQFRAAVADTAADAARFTQQLLVAAGTKLMHRRRFGDAVAVYQLLAERFPARPEAHASLGEAYLMAGRRDLAVASFEKAAALDENAVIATEYLRYLKSR